MLGGTEPSVPGSLKRRRWSRRVPRAAAGRQGLRSAPLCALQWVPALGPACGNTLHLLCASFVQMTSETFFPRWEDEEKLSNRGCLIATVSLPASPCRAPEPEARRAQELVPTHGRELTAPGCCHPTTPGPLPRGRTILMPCDGSVLVLPTPWSPAVPGGSGAAPQLPGSLPGALQQRGRGGAQLGW